jgi:MarR family transcriptional regulator, lower aerobic nicotinate degradation pathway regulator
MNKIKTAAKGGNDELSALYSRPGFMLRRAHQIAVSIFLDEGGDLGITTTQYGVMVLLRARPGVDQATLARMMGLDRSTTGLVVGKLEDAGYVTRGSDDADRRRKTLKLSASGLNVLKRLSEPAGEASKRILAPFNASEKKQFLALLERMVTTYNGVVRAPLDREG